MSELILCYVAGDGAYFTTQPLDKQWGDDWNDAPYEYNAGRPYEWKQNYARFFPDGRVEHVVEPIESKWEIKIVRFYAPLLTPCERDTGELMYSVEDVNNGKTPWLGGYGLGTGIKIFAGATVAEFAELVTRAGGISHPPKAMSEVWS